MDMIDLEQLRKDMEAGTQGDWWADPRSTEIIVVLGPHKKYVVVDVEDIDDQRRIARLPQLEREYIALREANDALAMALRYMVNHADQVERAGGAHWQATLISKEALTAYREATK